MRHRNSKKFGSTSIWAGFAHVSFAFFLLVHAAATSSAQTICSEAKSALIELLMIEEQGCPYCVRWKREIGPAYPNTDEGKFAPLRSAMFGDPAIKKFKNIAYSPTFLILRDNEEVGRLIGYAGPDFFWSLLAEQLKKAGYDPATGAAAKKDKAC